MNLDLARPRPMTVRDVMTTRLVTVSPSATVHEMAALMQSNAISALPVVDADGRMVGIVSEADLLLREAPPPQARILHEPRDRAIARQKSTALTAADAMTPTVVTVFASATIAAAARLLEIHRIKRLPVIDDNGALIGIVSRRDLLSAFTRSDDDIRRDVIEGVLQGWLSMPSDTVDVTVKNGQVTLHGRVDRRSDVPIFVRMVRSIDGVVGVDSDLTWDFDDRHVRPAAEVVLL